MAGADKLIVVARGVCLGGSPGRASLSGRGSYLWDELGRYFSEEFAIEFSRGARGHYLDRFAAIFVSRGTREIEYNRGTVAYVPHQSRHLCAVSLEEAQPEADALISVDDAIVPIGIGYSVAIHGKGCNDRIKDLIEVYVIRARA